MAKTNKAIKGERQNLELENSKFKENFNKSITEHQK